MLQKRWRQLSLLLLCGLLVGCQSSFLARLASRAADTRTADYGEKVFFFQDQPITFPDFTLTYQGMRHVASDKFPRGFDYHDFRVNHADEVVIVSWSSGTGVIDPSIFAVNGHSYQLELAYSEQLGGLAEDELVISHE